MIHIYFAGDYQSSIYCSSASEAKKKLSELNVKFRKGDFINGNYEDGLVYSNLPWVYEVEEGYCEEEEEMQIGGKTYIPIAKYSEKYGISKNSAFKHYKAGKISGMNVGKYNLVYLEDKSES